MSHASYDLHLHTCWSYDAFAQPESYLRQAHELGMRAIAITDHHGFDSREEAQLACQSYPDVRVIRAAELSVTTSIGEIDLLCFGLPRPLTPQIEQVLEQYHQWQRDLGAAIVRGMQAMGYAWTDEDRRLVLESYRPARVIAVQGLTHIRHQVQRSEFIRRGFIQNDEQYGKLLEKLGQTVACPPCPTVSQVVAALKPSGVLVVIAHPTGYFDVQNLERMDALRNECSLDGIEWPTPSVKPHLTAFYRQYCLKHGLVSTSGTDCHTEEHVQQLMGHHGGDEAWLDELLERLPVQD